MIRLDRDGHIATLTLDRPAARNALPIAGWRALAETAGELAAGDARAVILRSDVPVIFSAGADISEFGTFAGDDHATRQIGVAPGAKWIGCRNMNAGFGTPASYQLQGAKYAATDGIDISRLYEENPGGVR